MPNLNQEGAPNSSNEDQNQDFESFHSNPESPNEQSNSQTIGAKVLSKVNFEQRHREITDSSLKKVRGRGEKLHGTNPERRNVAYLNRIESLVEKHGSRAEYRLWQRSINNLIIQPEDIPDSYWRAQEQMLRDNGHARALDEDEKDWLADDIAGRQRESLESWSNYLGHPDSPYPLWFKIYAWDGVSKMGIFDKKKDQFAKRDKNTVAPYPKLNPAVLAKVFSAISDFYGIGSVERQDNEAFDDKELRDLASIGNFNKLYSKILLEQKAIQPTPERVEDVYGEWIEYLPGEENELAVAAEGTPWCIADPEMGREYLRHEDWAEFYGRNLDEINNHSKFLLFHLQDPETNILSKSACASIRLNRKGKVAEISGLKDGQGLEDSLLPIVEAKVKTLPGGEEYLEAFADKQMLISLDHKMQHDEELAKEELEFLYEVERPIKSLDTYNSQDPRIGELRQRYTLRDCLEKGVNLEAILLNSEQPLLDYPTDAEFYKELVGSGIQPELVESNIPDRGAERDFFRLIEFGADPNFLIQLGTVGPGWVIGHLEKLKSINTDLDTVADYLVDNYPSIVLGSNTVIEIYGAHINYNKLSQKLPSVTLLERYSQDTDGEKYTNLDMFEDRGVRIDIQNVVDSLEPDQILHHLDVLIDRGVEVDVHHLLHVGRNCYNVTEQDINDGVLDLILGRTKDPSYVAYKVPDHLKKECIGIFLKHDIEALTLFVEFDNETINEFIDTHPDEWRSYAERQKQK